MHVLTLGLMMAVLHLGGTRDSHESTMSGGQLRFLRVAADSAVPYLRPAWLQGDPADSLYRAARERLNRRDYREAADLFAAISDRFPRSGYAGDALYWQAFALYRLGADGDLHAALDALRRQQKKYSGAATQGDAATLERMARSSQEVAVA